MIKKIATATAAILLALMPLSAVHVEAATGTTNLIANPGTENPTTGATPDGWTASSWSTGTTKATTRVTTAHTGTYALKTNVTKAAAGMADGWGFTPVTITAGQSYEFSFWYQSTVDTQVDVSATVNGVADTFVTAFTVPKSAAWTLYKTTLTAPTGATNMTMTNYVSQVGSITTDDYSLVTYTPEALSQPIVSVSFDDGWANQYINARQILKDNKINSTFYLISDPLTTGQGTALEYMTPKQAQDLLADGHEIASHTIDHCSMNGTTISEQTNGTPCPAPTTAFVTNEMTKSKTDIEKLVPGAKVTSFAYPYGEYSTESINIGKNLYTSQRTVECGQNTKDTLDLTKLKGCDIGATAPDGTSVVNYAKGIIDNAIAQKTWTILFFHEIANAGQGVQGDEAYTTSIADFTAIMNYIAQKQTASALSNMSVAKAIQTIQGTVVTPPATKPGDVNGDNVVDEGDLSVMFTNWGKTNMTAAQGNLNGDTIVDEGDLSVLFTNWSK